MNKLTLIKIAVLLTILSAVLLCNAQITITSSNTKSERVCVLRASYAELYYKSDMGYYIRANSSNRFDKNYIVVLGESKDDAINTLNTLIQIGEEKQDVNVNNCGMNMRIYGNSFMGINAIFVKAEYYAGDFSLNVSELQKGVRKLQK